MPVEVAPYNLGNELTIESARTHRVLVKSDDGDQNARKLNSTSCRTHSVR
jgi:hypothetical protein